MAEVELAWRHLKGSVVAITGTDGKSTTTALAGHLFRELGFDTHVGGNIGIPLITFAGKTTTDSVIVAELSSFQLETIIHFRPDVAMLLNVTPDHLDRYDSMEDYFRAKMRIAMNQTSDDCFIYNRDDERARAGAGMVPSRALCFSTQTAESDIYYRDGRVFLHNGGRLLLETGNLRILGLHNVENAMAAVLSVLDVLRRKNIAPDYDRIARAAYSFPGLEHRLERVGAFRGREFINDSKATTVNAVLTALKSLKGQGVLILGGRTKGDDYAKIAAGLDGKIRSLVLIGESKESFSNIFSAYRQVTAATMDDAVAAAMRESREGDVILLSPACASFDMYKNYEERGAVFRQSFQRLADGVISWT
jgi:UDP-N-acetylmuramoylalanine--D-glutamate ligase